MSGSHNEHGEMRNAYTILFA